MRPAISGRRGLALLHGEERWQRPLQQPVKWMRWCLGTIVYKSLLYCLTVAAALDFEAPRVNLMTALAGLWGVRLTFNLARKGGYWRGGEDYRWSVMQERLGPLRFQLLNITFIAPGQMLIIWLFASPVHLGLAPAGSAARLAGLVGRGAVPDPSGTRDRRGRTDVGISTGQEVAHGGWRGDRRTIPDDRTVPLFPPSELCRRNRPVVDFLPVRRRGFRGMAALDWAGVHRPHADVHRVHPPCRIDFRREIPGLRRVPGKTPVLVPFLRFAGPDTDG